MKASHLVLFGCAGLWLAAPVRSADIVALCIGNDAYQRAEDVLDTPVADATLMKNTLEALPGGADVTLLTDASREDIQIALNSLVNRSRGAKLVLVFYSGHGLEGQPDGYPRADTFLLPVEATIPDVTYLPTRAVGLQSVLEVLAKCPVTARAVILDCCRSGAPKATAALKGSTKSFGDIDQSVKDALGAAVVPEATLVAFASGPLRKAAAFLQQSDSNSPFTLFIAESLATGTGNLRDLIEAAAERTEEATGMRQVPQVTYTGAASAIRQIVFRETAVAAVTPPGNSAEMAALKEQLALEKKAREEAERKAAIAGTVVSERKVTTVPPKPPGVSMGISLSELLSRGISSSEFEIMDTDQDGKLNSEEVSRFYSGSGDQYAVFRAMDRDGDGSVSLEESVEFVKSIPPSQGDSMPTRPSNSIPMVLTDPVPAPAFSATSGMEGSRAGEVREFCGIEMVWCPPGEFLMGSPASEADRGDDETQHRVRLTKGFWLAKTETTQAQWQSAMGSNPSEFTGDDLPVETVSWDDVQGWLQKMNQESSLPSGWAWALPSEAQWEYACRAGTETPFSFGSVLNGKEANCDGNYPYGTSVSGPYLEKTARAGSYAANAWGLHDMHGNVWEWCADYYGDYASGSATDPTGATTGSSRVCRGGGWSYYARFCRAADRLRGAPGFRCSDLGFRPALSSLPAR